MCTGRIGAWNDRRASPAYSAAALAHTCLANLEAVARIAADRGGWWIGSEGFSCRIAVTSDDEASAIEARATEQLVWDLQFGVEPRREAAGIADLIDDATRTRIAASPAPTSG